MGYCTMHDYSLITTAQYQYTVLVTSYTKLYSYYYYPIQYNFFTFLNKMLSSNRIQN